MCGIIAYTGKQRAAPILMQGLRKLEYRGYDSSGISVLARNKLRSFKAAGKLKVLESRLPANISGKSGIGHTRWATHGEPNDINAHPHTAADRVSLVHNGIIENAPALRANLKLNGAEFQSDTDTEVLAHLIAAHLQKNLTLAEATRKSLLQIRGTYGVAVIDTQHPGEIVIARNGSPVIIGIGDGEMLAASDVAALLHYTRKIIHLDDGEMATLTPSGFSVQTLDAIPTSKESIMTTVNAPDYDRGHHEHFMYKEITEQAATLKRTISGRLDHRFSTSHLGGLNLDARQLLKIRRVKLLGCGSAYYAALSGANMIESLARIASDAEPAAEFRYRNPMIESDTLYIVASQSGETYDTLAATREIKRKGGTVLGVVNSVGSTIAREVDGGIYMHAGPEISVASTKAYTSMLAVFSLLALHLARIRDLSPQQGNRLTQALEKLPHLIEEALECEPTVKLIAEKYARTASAFFIGRTDAYPIALEGAQKLKEISYIHAEAYPASELKHGPLALISEQTPSIVILPDNDLLDKSLSSLEEIKTRSGPVIAITTSNNNRIGELANESVKIPDCHELLHPIMMAIPLQLFAYHCALHLKRDIDQPRNLAKSVTVE